jgi:hypothetical protein
MPMSASPKVLTCFSLGICGYRIKLRHFNRDQWRIGEPMLKDDHWPVARLIPISTASGIEAQERKVTSALLAVMSAVDEFGRAMLKPLGAPAGRVETFIEVPFKLDKRSIRPDGVITVTRGSKTWAAIVETKTARNSLEPAQIDAYWTSPANLNSMQSSRSPIST